MLRPKCLLLLAVALATLAAAGCAKPPDTRIAYTPRVIGKKGSGGGGGGATIMTPQPAPPGYKTGDLRGGLK
ncbi:MAG TPA: hypothetical protein VKT32_17005 [Chthonomonadaceae bacterium]|nr:hypothetical protein [Chthonomonadaceae bacterium]